MLSHLGRHRNWIAPYPIDGLKAVLEEGMIQATDDREKNWLMLQSAFLLMYEKADITRIQAIHDRLCRDKEGRVLLERRDEGLFESIKMRLGKKSR